MAISSKPSYRAIYILVFGIAFGLIALAVGFKGVSNNVDLRSRASEVQRIIKAWEFNGTTTEGWINDNATVNRGKLFVSTPRGVTAQNIDNTSVVTTVPEGLKTIEVNMSVTIRGAVRPTPHCSPNVACDQDTNIITSTPVAAQPFTMEILYQRAGQNTDEFAGSRQTGIADGIARTYAFNLPTPESLTLQHIQIIIRGIAPVSIISIDWIRLLGPLSRPTPTPTVIQCPTAMGINPSSCAKDYTTQVSYTCSDGYSGILGDGKTCTLISTFQSQVNTICAKHSGCPTPYPTSYQTPYPTGSTGAPRHFILY